MRSTGSGRRSCRRRSHGGRDAEVHDGRVPAASRGLSRRTRGRDAREGAGSHALAPAPRRGGPLRAADAPRSEAGDRGAGGRRDREEEAPAYLRAGVEEVWLVDPATETIEVRTPQGVTRFDADRVAESPALRGVGVSYRELVA
ncbi:MAG: Uma2 family endonuclease [Candidatus Latescibacterota bacterium]